MASNQMNAGKKKGGQKRSREDPKQAQSRSKRSRRAVSLSPSSSSKKKKKASESSDEEANLAQQDEMLLEIPSKKYRDPNISTRGYEKHIQKNKVRLENDLGANDMVEQDEQDLQNETARKRLEYDALLTSQVYRYLWSNHIEKAVAEQLEAKAARASVTELAIVEVPEQPDQHQLNVESQAAEKESDENGGDVEPSNGTSTEEQNGGQAEAEAKEEVPEWSQEELEAMWKSFVDEGFFENKRVEFYDQKCKTWFAATIIGIRVDKKKVTVLPASFEKARLQIHCFGFKRRAARWYDIIPQDLAIKNLREKEFLAPPRVKTNGSGFPKPKAKKTHSEQDPDKAEENVEEEEEEEVEEKKDHRKSWAFNSSNLDLSNIVSGRRNRRTRELFVVEDTKAEENDELLKISDNVCALCGEHSFQRDLESEEQLYICEGGCNHVYHAPCLELDKIPEGKLICTFCQNDSHSCFTCLANPFAEEPDERTIQCSYKNCGRYFHPTCIRAHENRARILNDPRHDEETFAEKQFNQDKVNGLGLDPTNGSNHAPPSGETGSNHASTSGETGSNHASTSDETGKPAAQKMKFYCPAHCCRTCFEREDIGEEKAYSGKTHRCLACASAFHERCIPYGSLQNDLGILCNRCAREYDPPLCSSETSFLKQRRQRYNFESRIDFARFFQKQALEVNDDTFKPFNLPADILQEDPAGRTKKKTKENVKVSRSKAKIPKYTAIKRNHYSAGCKAIVNKDMLEHPCQCTRECDEGCQNRLLRIECFPPDSKSGKSNCNAYKCRNRMFQNFEYKKTRPLETPGRGWGLELCEDAQAGDFIIEYVGEVISAEEGRKRLKKTVSGAERHVFQMDLGNDQIIDARFKGNLARFINHSCDPNCVLHKWNVRGVTRIGIFATRDIQAGEELSFDYSFDRSSELDFVCLCGASNCRGTLTNITCKDSLAKRELEDVERRLKSIKRLIKQARGGVLKRNSLKRMVLADLSEVKNAVEEREKRQRRVALRAQRHNQARVVLSSTAKITRPRFIDFVDAPNKPFLVRNLIVGKNFSERLKLRELRASKKHP